MDNKTELQVIGVYENSYGSELGFKIDDIIVAFNSTPISSIDQLCKLIDENKGKQVSYTVRRGTEELTINAVSKPLNLTVRTKGSSAQKASTSDSSIMPGVFYILAIVTLILGMISAVKSMPTSSAGYGNYDQHTSNLSVFIILFATIVPSAIFVAIGKALSYLEQIAKNTAKN